MRKFFIQIVFFVTLLVVSFLWVFSRMDGSSDSYYLRFTTPEQSSLILGVSKAAQGLQPKVFNKVLNRNDMFNYSFNAFVSPFGKTYLESIKNKLNITTKNGIFIITLDVWSLGSNTNDPNDSTNFRELNLYLSNKFVTLNPNVPYMINFYEHKFIDIFRESRSSFFLHKDGWLEVNIPMDSLSKKIRLENTIKHYNELYTPFWKFSSLRFKYLSKTIEFLKKHGEVYLVRLPVHKELLKLEKMIVQDLDARIKTLSNYHSISYLNFTNITENYEYTDGVHLWKKSGAKVSQKIANWILH